MEMFVRNVKDLTENLLHNQSNDSLTEVIHKLFEEVLSFELPTKIQDLQIEECAIQLWNWAVTKNVGSSINEPDKAKVRHVACKLLYICEAENPSENTIRKQILMASKTGRTWLDNKNPKLADEFLNHAVNSLETLYSRLITHVDNGDTNSPKGDVEKDMLRVLSYQAESAVAQDNHNKAVSCIQRCKEMLLRFPKETGYLSLVCYNFGVDTYGKKKYEESSFWLSQSYDIGKVNIEYSTGKEMQAKVLRLLATVYLELDCENYWDKALHAVSMANEENLNPSGLYLKIRIMLKSRTPDEAVKSELVELLRSDVPLDVCLRTVKLLMEENRETLAFDFLKTVCQHFETSPELGFAVLLHIELLLLKGKELLGKQKIEDAITGHYSGRQLSPQILTSLHLLLWDKASKNFEVKNYYEALQWYNYSLGFYKGGELDQNLGKLQRNRASCFLHLQQLDKAKEAISEAARCDPSSIFTHFCVFKLAVLENNREKVTLAAFGRSEITFAYHGLPAKACHLLRIIHSCPKTAEAIREIGVLAQAPVKCEDRLLVTQNAASSLLSLAAQIALENEQQETAMEALLNLCEHSQDVVQVLSALRCLIRLKLSTIENTLEENREASLDALLTYLKMGLKNVSLLGEVPGQDVDQRSKEANWFRKIAWNTALQCENSPARIKDFFVLCYELSKLCVPDRVILMGQKTCLVMVVAACMEICRISSYFEQTEILVQALEYIQICWEVWRTLKASGEHSKDPTEALLLLYEFEARAKLNDPKLESVLESVLELDNIDTKMLDTIAALAMEPPAHFPGLCKKTLRIALSLHRQDPQSDLSHCSNYLHSLIQLSLPSGVCEVEPNVLEEVWGYYEEALSIITAAAENIPEVEILWLLTRAWNTGILLYSLAQYAEAEKWCGLGMSFLHHLGSMQESYQTQMSGLYSEVLDRLDKAKKNLKCEE